MNLLLDAPPLLVQACVFPFLTDGDLARVSRVCLTLREFVRDSRRRWASSYTARFGRPLSSTPVLDEALSPMDLYCRRRVRQAKISPLCRELAPLEDASETGSSASSSALPLPPAAAPLPDTAVRFLHVTRERLAFSFTEAGGLGVYVGPPRVNAGKPIPASLQVQLLAETVAFLPTHAALEGSEVGGASGLAPSPASPLSSSAPTSTVASPVVSPALGPAPTPTLPSDVGPLLDAWEALDVGRTRSGGGRGGGTGSSGRASSPSPLRRLTLGPSNNNGAGTVESGGGAGLTSPLPAGIAAGGRGGDDAAGGGSSSGRGRWSAADQAKAAARDARRREKQAAAAVAAGKRPPTGALAPLRTPDPPQLLEEEGAVEEKGGEAAPEAVLLPPPPPKCLCQWVRKEPLLHRRWIQWSPDVDGGGEAAANETAAEESEVAPGLPDCPPLPASATAQYDAEWVEGLGNWHSRFDWASALGWDARSSGGAAVVAPASPAPPPRPAAAAALVPSSVVTSSSSTTGLVNNNTFNYNNSSSGGSAVAVSPAAAKSNNPAPLEGQGVIGRPRWEWSKDRYLCRRALEAQPLPEPYPKRPRRMLEQCIGGGGAATFCAVLAFGVGGSGLALVCPGAASPLPGDAVLAAGPAAPGIALAEATFVETGTPPPRSDKGGAPYGSWRRGPGRRGGSASGRGGSTRGRGGQRLDWRRDYSASPSASSSGGGGGGGSSGGAGTTAADRGLDWLDRGTALVLALPDPAAPAFSAAVALPGRVHMTAAGMTPAAQRSSGGSGGAAAGALGGAGAPGVLLLPAREADVVAAAAGAEAQVWEVNALASLPAEGAPALTPCLRLPSSSGAPLSCLALHRHSSTPLPQLAFGAAAAPPSSPRGGMLLATGDIAGGICVWAAASGALLARLSLGGGEAGEAAGEAPEGVRCIALDDGLLAVGGSRGSVAAWALPPVWWGSVSSASSAIDALAPAPPQLLLRERAAHTSVRLLYLPGGAGQGASSGPSNALCSAAQASCRFREPSLSAAPPLPSALLTGGGEGDVRLWPLSHRAAGTGDSPAPPPACKLLRGHSGRVTGLYADCHKILTCSVDGAFKVWDAVDQHVGRCLFTLRLPAPATALACVGQLAGVGLADGRTYLFEFLAPPLPAAALPALQTGGAVSTSAALTPAATPAAGAAGPAPGGPISPSTRIPAATPGNGAGAAALMRVALFGGGRGGGNGR